MCRSCDNPSRRRVLSFLATGAVATGLLGVGAPRSLAAGATAMTADAASRELKAGNRSFLPRRQLCAVIWRSSAPMRHRVSLLVNDPHLLG